MFGGLGIAGYLGHLSYSLFKDSLVFPFALSLIGLAIIWLGVIWPRREAEWSACLREYLPAVSRELTFKRRCGGRNSLRASRSGLVPDY